MLDLVLLTFATFFVWESVRFALDEYLPGLSNATRVLHPLFLAVLPMVVLWPNWVAALGISGLAGLLIALADKFFREKQQAMVVPRRREPGRLPPLP